MSNHVLLKPGASGNDTSDYRIQAPNVDMQKVGSMAGVAGGGQAVLGLYTEQFVQVVQQQQRSSW